MIGDTVRYACCSANTHTFMPTYVPRSPHTYVHDEVCVCMYIPGVPRKEKERAGGGGGGTREKSGRETSRKATGQLHVQEMIHLILGREAHVLENVL